MPETTRQTSIQLSKEARAMIAEIGEWTGLPTRSAVMRWSVEWAHRRLRMKHRPPNCQRCGEPLTYLDPGPGQYICDCD